jgi:quinoprotein glucose dehydrogenase
VPKSKVPDEVSWPTQPFPVLPPPLAKNTFKPEDIYDLTPEHATFCRDLYEKNHMFTDGPYTPLPLENNALLFPSTLGGGNWNGFSYDPSLHLIFTNVMNIGQWGHMEKRVDPRTGKETYLRNQVPGGLARFWDPSNHIPCTKPPFSELVAVNVDSGQIAWRTPLGIVEELEAKGVHNSGAVGLGGSITTAAGLIFVAASHDSRFRAFESKTGRMLWETKMEASGHAVPITYQGKDGRQYVVIMAANGGGYFGGPNSDTLMAYALPQKQAQ